MNYENMTDAQINEAVTDIVSGSLAKELGVVDYCNDWAYGGLIIQSARISIDFHGRDCTASARVVKGFFIDEVSVSAHKNPLRAAMIVYLKMNEDKK